MHKIIQPLNLEKIKNHIRQFPHCDQRILHAPGECTFCDEHPEWQALRLNWGIAFTGWEPDLDKKELPCPASHARGETGRAWIGNIPQTECST